MDTLSKGCATSTRHEAYSSVHTPSEVVSRTEMQEGGQGGIASCTCSTHTTELNQPHVGRWQQVYTCNDSSHRASRTCSHCATELFCYKPYDPLSLFTLLLPYISILEVQPTYYITAPFLTHSRWLLSPAPAGWPERRRVTASQRTWHQRSQQRCG